MFLPFSSFISFRNPLLLSPRKRKGEKLKECSNSQRAEQGSSQGGARGSNSYQGGSEEEVERLNSGRDGWMVDGWLDDDNENDDIDDENAKATRGGLG